MLLLTVSAVLFAVLAAICVFLHCVWLVAGEEASWPPPRHLVIYSECTAKKKTNRGKNAVLAFWMRVH